MNDDYARQLISAIQRLDSTVSGVQTQLQSMNSNLGALSTIDVARALNKLVEHAEKVFEINLENAVLRVLQEDNTRLNLELNKVQYEYAELKMRIIENSARKQHERHERAIAETQSAVPQGVPGSEEVPTGAGVGTHPSGGRDSEPVHQST